MMMHVHIKVYPFLTARCRCPMLLRENLTFTMESSSKIGELKEKFENLRGIATSKQLLVLPTEDFGKDTFEEIYHDICGIELQDDHTFEGVSNNVVCLLFITR